MKPVSVRIGRNYKGVTHEGVTDHRETFFLFVLSKINIISNTCFNQHRV